MLFCLILVGWFVSLFTFIQGDNYFVNHGFLDFVPLSSDFKTADTLIKKFSSFVHGDLVGSLLRSSAITEPLHRQVQVSSPIYSADFESRHRSF
jgi:hypothetical protein